MPEVLLHISIPFAILSPIVGIRRALAYSLIALTPDVIDVLMGVHRSWTHSLIVLTIVSFIAYVVVSMFSYSISKSVILAYLVIASHLVLDMFQTYTPILWPLTSSSVWVNMESWVSIQGSDIMVSLNVETVETTFNQFTRLDAPLFTSTGLAITLVLLTLPAYITLNKLILSRARRI